MTKIAITGGCGFIGSWIAEALLEDGHEVMVMDDLSAGNLGNLPSAAPNLCFCRIDLRRDDEVTRAFGWFEPEIVYHLAANAREGASFFQPISVTSRNTGAYTNVLTAGIGHGMRRMILFSSMSVYGNQLAPFSEAMPKQPVDVYGLAKAQMEDLTAMLAGSHGFEWVIIRPHNVFGPRQALDDHFRNVLGIWMNSILRGEPINVYGDGEQMRAFSYVEDSLPCYVRAMSCPSGTVVNIGGEMPCTINAALHATLEMMGTGPDYPVVHVRPRHGEVKIAYSGHAVARAVLGLEEKIGFREGLMRMAEWAKTKGPQAWHNYDVLEIPNHLTPSAWVSEAAT